MRSGAISERRSRAAQAERAAVTPRAVDKHRKGLPNGKDIIKGENSVNSQIDKAFWQTYYKFWDDFVGEWFTSMQRQHNLAECTALQFGKACGLNLDELPEPYYGKPHEGVDAVFINLNPGMSSEDDVETAKFLSKLNDPVHPGWLIQEFVELGKCYREYANSWSCLDPTLRNHDPEVSGVRWWQELEPRPIGGRMSWVRRIYDNEDMSPLMVFALELCPFHSKQWEISLVDDQDLKDFICEHVIDPAIVATVENELPFAIAVGAGINDVLSNVDAKVEQEWICDSKNRQRVFNDDTLKDIWPTANDDRFIVRSYRLYTVRSKDRTARILATWASGGNKCPSDDFHDVEERIRQYVRTHIVR